MHRVGLALVLVSLGCASLPIRPPDAAALAEADRQVLAGCYDCLLDARATYERIGVGRARPLVIARLFEVQVLIVLRELELALDWQPARQRADALAAELPAAAQATGREASPPIDGARILALVDLVPPESDGWPDATRQAHRRRVAPQLSALPGELAWLDSSSVAPAVRAYLRMSLECGYTASVVGQPRRPLDWKPELPADAPPLLAYRRALCGVIAAEPLAVVRAESSRFLEIAGPLGRLAVAAIEQTGDVATALAEVHTFHERFPQSSAAAYLYGTFHQSLGDCEAAIPFYDGALMLQPSHEDALLARTTCLSHLQRHEEAIAAAGRVIAQPTAQVADGFYWRAWNRWMLKQLPDARQDIERAKSWRRTGQILTLAGAIAHDQDDLEPAETDLKAALSMSGGSTICEAAWYLGLVHDKKEMRLEGARQFEAASACYLGRQSLSEANRRTLGARDDIDLDFKARKIAALDAAIREARTQRAGAAYNAARLHLQSGNVDRARQLVEVAALEPSIADEVSQLRVLVERR